MASNITQATSPSLWTSANDDIIYNFLFDVSIISSVADDGGFAKITLSSPLNVTPTIGETFNIIGGIYAGFHKITSVTSLSILTLDVAYISTTTGVGYHLRVPIFSFYKGYKLAEGAINSANLPYTFVTLIKPSILYFDDGVPYLEINVKGLTSRLFTIASNTVANSVDYSMFNVIRLEWDGLTTVCVPSTYDYNIVLNSSISNNELLNKITLGFYLTPLDKPLISTKGATFLSYVDVYSSAPIVHKYINAVKQ